MRLRPQPRALVPFALALLCTAALLPRVRKLNGPLARAALADVIDYQLSPDGRWTVYLADADVDGSFELYAREVGSGARAIRLDPPELADRVPVTGSLRIDAGSTRLAYLAHPAASSLRGLFSVPLDGSASAQSLAPLVREGSVQSFELSADGGVVYLADALRDERVELLRAPLDGSAAPVLLSGTLAAAGDVTDFALDDPGRSVVFRADALDDVFELFRAPLDGSRAPVRLNSVLSSGGDVQPGFQLAPDGGVVYVADQLVNDKFELFAVREGAAPVLLSVSAVNGRLVERARLTPDGAQVVFLAKEPNELAHELFVVPRDGSRLPTLLHAPLPVSQRFGVRDDFQIGPDGTRVAFRMDRDRLGNYELFGAPLDGSSLEALLSQVIVEGNEAVAEFRFGAHDERVAFRAPNGFHFNLYSAPSDGSAPPVQLDRPRFSFSFSDVLSFTTSGERALFLSDQDNGSYPELFSVPLDGATPPLKLHPTLTFGSRVRADYRLTPDGAGALFLTDLETPGADELYLSALDGSADPQRLNQAIHGTGPVAGDVIGFTYAGERVLYYANEEVAGRTDLYSVPLDGGAPAVRLSQLGTGGEVRALRVAPDGQRVFLLSDGEENERFELYAVPADGSAAAVKLNGALVAGGDVTAPFELSGDGRWLVYRADQEVDEQFELYAVPLDGSAGPRRLDPQTHVYGDCDAFQLTPDSTRVVFLSDRAVRDKSELYAVPIDGSGAPVRVSAPLVAGGDVEPAFQLSADSTRVVYLADQDVNDVPEVCSAPLDASAPAVTLNAPLGRGEGVRDFRLSDDGARVLYRALHGGRLDLFSAPSAGGAPPLTFFAEAQRVFRAYSAIAGRALFYADPSGLRELFSAPLDGSGPTVRLNDPLLVLSFTAVGPYHVSPDKRWVVYQAPQDFPRHPDLYRVPLEGGVAPVCLTTSFSDWDVLEPPSAFQFDAQGQSVLIGVRDHGRGSPALHQVPLFAGSPRRVTPKLPDDRQGCRGAFTAAGDGVVFVGDLAQRNRFELFTTSFEPLASAAPVPSPLR
ncbi:MAG: hypothetical protein EXS08_09725 [Planctomycetes bacterium]|nr:hypothetical protein [Planctomycetota bacterium]